MLKVNRLRPLFCLAALAAFGSPHPALADDRVLLFNKLSAPTNVMVVLANTETMASCFPGLAQPNGLTCTAVSGSSPVAFPVAFDGMADGPSSKFGVSKNVLRTVILNNPKFNWGISSYSSSHGNFQTTTAKKRYVFLAWDDSFSASDPAFAYQKGEINSPGSGTMVNFGAAVGSAKDQKYGSVTYRQIQYVSSAGTASETWVTAAAGDTDHQPYLGSLGTVPTLIYDPNASGSNKSYEVVVSPNPLLAGPNNGMFRIKTCVNDCTAGDAGFDGGIMTVTKTLYKCSGGNAPCDPLANNTSAVESATVRYVIPTSYCADSDATCRFAGIYGYGSQAGEEMGWTDYNEMNQTADPESGWITQANNNAQPEVMIPHGYQPFTPYGSSTPTKAKQSYTQSGTPCILRSLRPVSAVYDNTANTTPGISAEHDYFPIFDPTSGTGDQTAQCDKLVDGLYQTDSYRLDSNSQPTESKNQEILATLFPRQGAGAKSPISKMLTNAFEYFNGGNNPGSCNAVIDGFCGGKRPDDPSASCRSNAIILVTDSLVYGNPAFQFGKATDPTSQLAALNIPVYVVGFSYPSAPQNGQCTLPDSTSGNLGQCIAFYTGAQTYVNGKLAKTGYFEATTPAGLLAALNTIIGELNSANRDFATATIPSVSATSEGIGYFASFNPRTNHSIWSGHLRAYVLNPLTGLPDTTPTGTLVNTPFSFWSGTTLAQGNEIWDAGNGGDSQDPTDFGILGKSSLMDTTQVLTAGTSWSDGTHDQARGSGKQVGRNVFFSLRPGDANCLSTNHTECIVQLPTGSGGNNSSEPYTPPSPPSSLPPWWTLVRDNYLGVTLARSGESSVDQATQNDFSFFRGNRDPVVEALKLVVLDSSTIPTCAAVDTFNADPTNAANQLVSPCYSRAVMGDIFHSNPVVESFPFNVTYLTLADPGATSPGLYSNRGNSYVTFFKAHRLRRKIMYTGGDDGFLHAFDVGVFNGDLSTFTDSLGNVTTPLQGAYDFGSGREIFGYAPRAALRKFDSLTHSIEQDYTVDGPSTIDDVYINLANVGGTPTGVPAPTSTTTTDATHAWRTVILGVEREGGTAVSASPNSGNGGTIFALDVTDPDNPEHQNFNLNTDPTKALDLTVKNPASGHAPDCLVNAPGDGTLGAKPGSCNQSTAYPAVLWEISDANQPSTVPDATTPGVLAETSGSNEANTQDMGLTWSRPQISRIRVCTSCGAGQTLTDFYVAIVGGGYSHIGDDLSSTNTGGNTGNFLYMIDIETGKVIWKRNIGQFSTSATNSSGYLPAGLAGEPAIVDYNRDGYADRIYIGDTQGRIWKVALETPAAWDSTNHRVSDSDTNWNPSLFFDEYNSTTLADFNTKFPGQVRQPIFMRPAVSSLGTTASGPKLAISVGTGDRDNMPSSTDTFPNYFIVAIDDPTQSTYPIFLNKSSGTGDLTLVNPTATNPASCTGSNCLNARGYFVQLPVGTDGAQVVNTAALILNDVIYFNTFLHVPTASNPCQLTGEPFAWSLAFQTGISQTTANGAPVLPSAVPYSLIASDPIAFQYGGNIFPYSALINASSGSTQTTSITSTSDALAYGNTQAAYATDIGAAKAGKGAKPNVNIKNWKEQ